MWLRRALVLVWALGALGCGQIALGVILATDDSSGSSGGAPATTRTPEDFGVTLSRTTGTALGGTVMVATVVGVQVAEGLALEVRVGGASGRSVQRLSSDRVGFLTPPNPAGNVSRSQVVVVRVGERVGRASFDYVAAAPLISSVEPAQVRTGGGEVVTVRGAGFVEGTTVEVAGRSLVGLTLVSEQELRFRTQAGPEGSADVTVIHPDAARTTWFGGLEYVRPTPAALRFVTQPSTVRAGVASIDPPVEVEVLDAEGQRITDHPGSVRIGLGSTPGGALQGSLEQGAVGGVARFVGLGVEAPGVGYVLEAQLGGLRAMSDAFEAVVGPPAELRWVAQPSGGVAGVTLSPAFEVEVVDSVGFRTPAASAGITLELVAHPGGAALAGTLTQTPVDGVAVFPGVTVDRAAAGLQVRATSPGLDAQAGSVFGVDAGPPTTLAIVTEPRTQRLGRGQLAPVRVEVRDAGGGRTRGQPQQVQLELAANPGGATLSGGGPVQSVDGLATFPDVELDALGVGYTLRATAAGLTSATTQGFDVVERVFGLEGVLASPVPSVDGFVMALGDVDGDGVLDRATSYTPHSANTHAVGVALGRGGGTFGDEVRYAVGRHPHGVELVDLDDDRDLDLVVVNSGTNDMSVFLNDGGGDFGTEARVSVGSNPQNTVGVGDVDGDGDVDLVIPNAFGGNVTVQYGDGAGGFPTQQRFGVGPQPHTARFYDLDLDGHLDILAADRISDTLSVLWGDGAGGFGGRVVLPVGDHARDAIALDLDLDGDLDVVSADEFGGTVSTVPNLGPRSFGPATTLPCVGDPFSLAATDVDFDGRPDVLVATVSGDALALHRGRAGGGVGSLELLPVAENPTTVRVGDVDGDGTEDAVVHHGDTPVVGTLLGGGPGGLRSHLHVPAPQASQVALGDLDGQAGLDLVYGGDPLHARLAASGGGFEAPSTLSASDATWFALGDLNGIGGEDLLTVHELPGGAELQVRLVGGGGVFGGSVSYALGGRGPGRPWVGDVDGDAVPDVLVPLREASSVAFLRGLGGGTLSAPTLVPCGLAPTAVVAGHLDAGGDVDLVALGSADAVAVVLATGPGAFGVPSSFATGQTPRDVVLGDATGDGVLDVIVSNEGSDTVQVLRNDGSGSLSAGASLPTADRPLGLAAGDLDGDGALDLFVVCAGTEELFAWRGRGDGTFEDPLRYLAPAGEGIALADQDGDGVLDVVVGGARGVSVLYGH